MTICTPHKVGSQTWRYFFQQLDQKDQGHKEEDAEAYYSSEWPNNAKSFYKGFQVRHPLERLLSSYRFIFERDAMRSTIQDMNKLIFDTYPDPANTYNLTEFEPFKFTPTFKQFLQFVVNTGDDFGLSEHPVVSHWLPFYMACNPCHPGKNGP